MRKAPAPVLTGLLSKGQQPTVAATPIVLPSPAAPVGTVAITVRLDAARYARLRDLAHQTGKTHRDLMIEGFDKTFGT